MAAALRNSSRPLVCRFLSINRQYTTRISRTNPTRLATICGCAAGAAVSLYCVSLYRKWGVNCTVHAKDMRSGDAKVVAVQTQREMRFLSFASIEYEDSVYMTPQDFLESVTEEAPRPRVGRTRLHKDDVEKHLKNTPSRWRGSSHLFRNLHDKGLISYTEYLFLLCVLTKPHSGFGIAFNMFDTDGNQRVDKKEFLVMEQVLCGQPSSAQIPVSDGVRDSFAAPDLPTRKHSPALLAYSSHLQQLVDKGHLSRQYEWSHRCHTTKTWRDRLVGFKGSSEEMSRFRKRCSCACHSHLDMTQVNNGCCCPEQLVNLFRKAFGREPITQTDPQPTHKNLRDIVSQYSGDAAVEPIVQDTTLTVHFFGRRGTEVLKYEDFARFMDNLQTEVMELEFNEFSRGMPQITEEEFATILLRYTILSKEEHQEYLQRLRQRVPHVKGISFKDFKEFGQFLNNLDDFAIAMRMYTMADQPISEGEFKRAVKVCTGQSLNSHLVHTVFQLFDLDGDGHLSHKEFISVMKDRLHRGFKSHLPQQTTWDTFKSCVKNEMRKV